MNEGTLELEFDFETEIFDAEDNLIETKIETLTLEVSWEFESREGFLFCGIENLDELSSEYHYEVEKLAEKLIEEMNEEENAYCMEEWY